MKMDKSKKTIAGSIDGRVYVFDKNGSILAVSEDKHDIGVYAVDIENGFAVTGDEHGMVKFWSYNRKKVRLLKSMKVMQDEINILQLVNTEGGAKCTVVSNDGCVKVLKFKM